MGKVERGREGRGTMKRRGYGEGEGKGERGKKAMVYRKSGGKGEGKD
jgi:hypothetical protein